MVLGAGSYPECGACCGRVVVVDVSVGLMVLLLCGVEEGRCLRGCRPRWARDGERGVLDCDPWQRLKEV